MRQRSDGVETRKRILESACAVFVEKGFHDATIAEICRGAQTNTASVNYHFRDKESLYVEVWKHCARQAADLYPVDGGVPPGASAADRLRGHIGALLKRMTDTGRLGHFHRLHMKEMTNPTGLIDEVIKEIRQPYREQVRKVLRELLGPQATTRAVDLVEMSVIGQCIKARFGPEPKFLGPPPALTAAQVEQLVDHITRFSLAGLGAVRERLEAVVARSAG
ncbi:CerR family C-terminal domain-containing protein [bacterium]|nr:CerR family C-terminal domain-containing protein [bacterium]